MIPSTRNKEGTEAVRDFTLAVTEVRDISEESVHNEGCTQNEKKYFSQTHQSQLVWPAEMINSLVLVKPWISSGSLIYSCPWCKLDWDWHICCQSIWLPGHRSNRAELPACTSPGPATTQEMSSQPKPIYGMATHRVVLAYKGPQATDFFIGTLPTYPG